MYLLFFSFYIKVNNLAINTVYITLVNNILEEKLDFIPNQTKIFKTRTNPIFKTGTGSDLISKPDPRPTKASGSATLLPNAVREASTLLFYSSIFIV